MAPALAKPGFFIGKWARRCSMGRKKVLTEILTALLVISMGQTAWAAGDNVTISMSLTIPAIPGVNAPGRIPETVMQDYRRDVTKNNSAATVGEETIEKEESKVNLLAQGEKVTGVIKTVYAR
jgi:hypothetical protein